MENPQSRTYRYERKFFVHNTNRASIEKIIMHHPAFFCETYHERYVNNIYFDTIDLKNFVDNIDGNMFRTKYRIRWYGDMFTLIEKPILELKIKKGLVGTKRFYKLDPFKFKKGVHLSELNNVIQNSNIDLRIKLSLKGQIPIISNRYKRKYFESNDRKFRITIDDELSFSKLNTFNNTFLQNHQDTNGIIIELKYDKINESEAEKITNQLPFRITKSSKYAKAVQLLYS